MAPKMRLTAVEFESKYGDLVRVDYAAYKTAYTLRKALAGRQPPVYVTDGVLKVWFHSYSRPADAINVSSDEELLRVCGHYLYALAGEHSSVDMLTRALTKQQPPVYADAKIVRKWLLEHFNLARIHSAGHLELKYGTRIRESLPEVPAAQELRIWLRSHLRIEASLVTCQTWVSRDWSTSGRLLSIQCIEDEVGERLRLPRYRDSFGPDVVVSLVETLAEGQPPVFVTATLLRQWYARFHPASGPIRIEDAEELERYVGEEIRRVYAGMDRRALQTALSRRLKPVFVGQRTLRTWTEKYQKTTSRCAMVFKRPAAVVSRAQPVRKRPLTGCDSI